MAQTLWIRIAGVMLLGGMIVGAWAQSDPTGTPGASQEGTNAVTAAETPSATPEQPAPATPAAGADTNAVPAAAESGGDEHESVTPVSQALQRMYEALLDVQDKEHERAIPKLEWVIKEDPTLLGAWEALGWSYWETGRKQEAEDLWERLLKLAPNLPMPYNLLAQVASQRKDLVRAEQLLRRSLELDPDQFETRVSLAKNLSWQGRPEDAIPLLEALLKEDPDRLDVRIEMARVYYTTQRYDDALKHWKVICEQIPDNPEFLVEMGRCHLFVGDIEEAQTAARQALELDKNHLGALNLLIDVAEGSHRPETAIPEFRKLIDQTSDAFIRSRLRYRLMVTLRALHDLDEKQYPYLLAIEECRRAIDDDPLFTEGKVFLAELCIADRRYGEATDLLKKVLEDHNPRNQRAIRGLFECAYGTGDYDEAERRLKEFCELLDPNDPYRYAEMARMAFARGRFAEAMELLDQLETEGARGAVFCLLYHGISPSEFDPAISERLFREHILSLKKAGYRFITPDQFESYFKSHPVPERPDPAPFGNRVIRRISYEFTGRNKPGTFNLDEYRPDKVVCVTFDDAMRTAFWLGTPIAEEFDVPFTMFVSVGNIEQHSPGISQWPEIRRYRDTGYWTIGSHLYNTHLPQPVNDKGYLVNTLPNRMWDADRKKLETVRSWFQRVRAEFRDSRKEISRQLNMDEKDFMAVAYPYGDIGQENDSNVGLVENVIATILNESSMVYPVGFVQNPRGHATAAANPLLYPRYEPTRYVNGKALVRHALESNPVILARKMRAEMASLQGKPYLATRMLKLLERDGYPTEALQELSKYVEDHLANRVAVVQDARGSEHERERSGLSLSGPYIGVEALSVKANRDIDDWEVAGRVGLNLTPQLTVEGRYGWGSISQEVRSNQWYTTTQRKESKSWERRTTTSSSNADGTAQTSTSVDEVAVVSYTDEQISTNRLIKRSFAADTTHLRLRGDYRFRDGSTFSANVGQRELTITKGDKTSKPAQEPVYGLAYQWKPALALDVMAAYTHDLVPSARRGIVYDAGGINGVWRIQDWWEMGGRAIYSFYDDDNSMLNLTGNSFWQVAERQNLWLGIEGQLATMDKESEYYWAPYWDERLYLVARLQRTYANYFTSFELRAGSAREKARPDELEQWKEIKARADAGGWYAGANPQADWETVVGAACTFRRYFGKHWELYADANVTFFKEYAERSLSAGLVLHF